MSGPRQVHIHYRRPPDRVRIFHQEVLLERDDVIVTLARSMSFHPPIHIDENVVLEDGSSVVWFTFPGRWHDIGRFHRADGSFTGIYANILTPPEMKGDAWYTTDLYLDVWLPPGGDPRVLDEEEFRRAVEQGLVDPSTARQARYEVEAILSDLRAGRWPPPVVEEWTLERALGSQESSSSTR
ncbi:MAG: DUF402 domain-containing protein [Gemmatimonadota bacterium]